MKIETARIAEIAQGLSTITNDVQDKKQLVNTVFDLEGEGLEVKYFNNTKGYHKRTACEKTEDEKHMYLFNTNTLMATIMKCLPSGLLKIKEVNFDFSKVATDKTCDISVVQLYETNSETHEYKQMGNKNFTITCNFIDENTSKYDRVSLGTDYDDFYASEMSTDFTSSELSMIANRLAVEKAKLIYTMVTAQEIALIANDKNGKVVLDNSNKPEVTDAEREELYNKLVAGGTKENTAKIFAANLGNRIMTVAVISTDNITTVAKLFNKSNKVSMHTAGKYIYFSDIDNETACCVENASPSKNLVSVYQALNGLKYSTFQMTFIKDFLNDAISSVISSRGEKSIVSSSADVTFKEIDGAMYMLMGTAGNTNNIKEDYKVRIDSLIGDKDALLKKTFVLPIKTISEVLTHISEQTISLDFNIDEANPTNTRLRISEVNGTLFQKNYSDLRNSRGLGANEATPDDLMIEIKKASYAYTAYLGLTVKTKEN